MVTTKNETFVCLVNEYNYEKTMVEFDDKMRNYFKFIFDWLDNSKKYCLLDQSYFYDSF